MARGFCKETSTGKTLGIDAAGGSVRTSGAGVFKFSDFGAGDSLLRGEVAPGTNGEVAGVFFRGALALPAGLGADEGSLASTLAAALGREVAFFFSVDFFPGFFFMFGGNLHHPARVVSAFANVACKTFPSVKEGVALRV